MATSCIFCEIIAGRKPASIVYQDDRVTAFKDQFPRAPIHILIVPNQHFESVSALTENDAELAGHLILVARTIAHEAGLNKGGYRIVINTGPNAGQSVFHLHVHMLGGKPMPLMGG
ncbi:MAG: histidine triad nucleotide-binding protein [Leptolinea sp.]|nr:histidine triad nucleotide-binding protein [Leptolinea sp.]